MLRSALFRDNFLETQGGGGASVIPKILEACCRPRKERKAARTVSAVTNGAL